MWRCRMFLAQELYTRVIVNKYKSKFLGAATCARMTPRQLWEMHLPDLFRTAATESRMHSTSGSRTFSPSRSSDIAKDLKQIFTWL